MKIDSTGKVILSDDVNIQGTTYSAGFLNFNSSGNVRLSANDDVRIGYSGTYLTVKNTGLVGIGTTTPNSYNAAANHLVIVGTGNTGLTIAGGTSNDSNIAFADGTSGADAYRGILRYAHANDSMQFYTNALERARIDSSGVTHIMGATASVNNSLQLAYNSTAGSAEISAKSTGGNTHFEFYTSASGTTTEKMKLNSDGAFKLNTYGSGTHTGTATKFLAVDSSGNVIEEATSTIDGSGTANKIVKWSDADTITDSIMTESTNTIQIL